MGGQPDFVSDVGKQNHDRRKRQDDDKVDDDCAGTAEESPPPDFMVSSMTPVFDLRVASRARLGRDWPTLGLRGFANLEGLFFCRERELFALVAHEDSSMQRHGAAVRTLLIG